MTSTLLEENIDFLVPKSKTTTARVDFLAES
jgi:hypothetical protein